MTTTLNPTPICGNPDHYDETVYCPHCQTILCADWDNCPDPVDTHDVPNCPVAEA
jgi:hypothetical protein